MMKEKIEIGQVRKWIACNNISEGNESFIILAIRDALSDDDVYLFYTTDAAQTKIYSEVAIYVIGSTPGKNIVKVPESFISENSVVVR